MPIHYASVINNRNVIVLQGCYEQSQTIFKSQVISNSKIIKRYGYAEAPIEGNLRILYHNWDMVTAAIVISQEVDK